MALTCTLYCHGISLCFIVFIKNKGRRITHSVIVLNCVRVWSVTTVAAVESSHHSTMTGAEINHNIRGTPNSSERCSCFFKVHMSQMCTLDLPFLSPYPRRFYQPNPGRGTARTSVAVKAVVSSTRTLPLGHSISVN